jgi:phosphoribosyl-AMP cyclohydrolase
VSSGAASDWLDAVKWDAQGLVPAIAQDAASGEILMVAWMNREALEETARTQRGVYWSRSRNKLWRKGEESGHVQNISEIRLDCDNDVVLLKIEQIGGIACHTGRRSCFFQKLDRDNQGSGHWVTTAPVLKNPDEIYHK